MKCYKLSMRCCLVILVLVTIFEIGYCRKRSRRKRVDDAVVANYLSNMQDSSDDTDEDVVDDPSIKEEYISTNYSKPGRNTYHITTIVKDKVHNKKSKKAYKPGTVLEEKTKTITIVKSKVKKQLNNNETKKRRNKKKKRRNETSPSRRKSEDIDEDKDIGRRNVSPTHPKPYMTLTLKVLVHYDSILTKKLYSNRSRLLVRLDTIVILQEVRNIFANSELRINIIFQLMGAKFLKSSNTVALDANAIKYLESYCQWQGDFKKKEQYYSILFTGVDIIHYDASGKGSKKNTARSYEGGHCSLRHSCMASEWRDNKKLLAFLLAHELAHSLGVNHDGPPYNKCKPNGFVMGSSFDPYNPPTKWSTCSGLDLREYLASNRAWCLPRLTHNII